MTEKYVKVKESYNFGVDTKAKQLYTETTNQDETMVEKRFTMIYFETDGNLIFDENKHDGEWYDSTECLQDKEILDLLNAQHEENERLKQQLNYIQNSISEHIKHQKTELGQKALKEIIEDYNEWLLGHKELKE